MVADALKVFGDHQQVKGVFSLGGVLGDHVDQTALDPGEVVVHHVVVHLHGLGEIYVLLDVGVHAVRNHGNGLLCHLPDLGVFFMGMGDHAGDDLHNVLRLISNTLHVRDHFQRGGDGTQVPRHRLLAQKQTHTDGLDGALLFVDLRADLGDLLPQLFRVGTQRLRGKGDDLLAQGTHFRQFLIQQQKLLFK